MNNSLSWQEVLPALEAGILRAAELTKEGWRANIDVKKAILSAFKDGKNKVNKTNNYRGFIDKDTLPIRKFALSDGVRIVPGGSSVRCGSYIAIGVIIMPPSYVNIGAYIDEGTMVDSHVLVGSCAQIGKRVHLSAGVQIGGVLEPINSHPVIIEDDVFVGAGCVIVEGIIIKKHAVIAPGVTLSKAIPIYDCVREVILPSGSAVPENAVVVPGTRPVTSTWGKTQYLQMACPLIVKYRDEKTDAALVLEKLLR